MHAELFKRLCAENPDAYVKIGNNEFFPVRSEILDFPLIISIMESFKNQTYTTEVHENLPVILHVEKSEETCFLSTYFYKMVNEEVKMLKGSPQEQVDFLIFLSYITGDPKIMCKFLKSCGFQIDRVATKVWIKLSSSGISSQFLTFEDRYSICLNILRYYLSVKPVNYITFQDIKYSKFIDEKYPNKISRICDFYGIIFGELLDYDPVYSLYVEHKHVTRYAIENVIRTNSYITAGKISCLYFLCRPMKTYYYPGLKSSHLKDFTRPLFSSSKIDTQSKLHLPSTMSQFRHNFEIIVDRDTKNRKYNCGYCREILHQHSHGN